jgi:uncharacterized phage protein (predicted DNA packaging)
MSELRVVTLDELKAQMRVDFEDEDNIIKLYGCAAEDAIIGGTNRTLDELKRIGYAEKNGTEDGELFPDRLRLAILILAAHNYRNREPVSSISQNAVPYSLDVYCKPYRKLTDREV